MCVFNSFSPAPVVVCIFQIMYLPCLPWLGRGENENCTTPIEIGLEIEAQFRPLPANGTKSENQQKKKTREEKQKL